MTSRSEPGPRADVVVVGGGSAGCVLAARLSENPSCSVILVEAGPVYTAPDWPAELLDPSALPVGPGSIWAETFPAALTPARPTTITRGRVLGGSGAVNGGYFVRARPQDFDAWPSSWSWDTVLPYYRRLESDANFQGPEHGTDGPVPVTRPAPARVTEAFESACNSLGFVRHSDLNSSSAGDGYGPVPSNVHAGVRVNTALAYLEPAAGRPNLSVMAECSVARVRLTGTRVIGVEGRNADGPFVIDADQVVLAAGAVRSPALLMHSGIGDADALAALGVTVALDLPGVGRGFSDHPEVVVPYRLRGQSTDTVTALQSVLHEAGVEFRPYTAAFDRMIAGLPVLDPALGVAAMAPASRGDIVLRSSDPYAPPEIDYHYLASDADRDVLTFGVDLARQLLSSAAMADVVESVSAPLLPGELDLRLGTSLHLCASARMGAVADGAVVDDRCRVHGIDGLRVVDTSIFPVVPSRGPHATAVMVAERAASSMAEDLFSRGRS